jgi:hypothetical protein
LVTICNIINIYLCRDKRVKYCWSHFPQKENQFYLTPAKRK